LVPNLMTSFLLPQCGHDKAIMTAPYSNNALRSIAAQEVLKAEAKTANPNLKAFLIGQSYIDWVRTHVLYDRDIAEGLVPFYKNPLLSMTPAPATVCGGYSWLTALLAKISGQADIWKVEGRLRDSPDFRNPNLPANHSWVVLCLPDGTNWFADPSNGRMSLDVARQRQGQIVSPYSLPIENAPLGYFFATHWSMNRIEWAEDKTGKQIGKPVKLDRDPFVQISRSEWADTDFSSLNQLRNLCNKDIPSASIHSFSAAK